MRNGILAVCICASAFAGSETGFSPERLNRISQVFQADVDAGRISGAVVLIGRDGATVYFQAIGYQDRGKNLPMKTDSLFRIASLTKPVTSVAVMMLAEEGKIDVGAPVWQYLAEFKDLKVGVEKHDPATGKPKLSLETPRRAMTVQDLLRHTSGLVYGFFGDSVVDHAYLKANLLDRNQTLAEMVTRLSKLPLAHEPGTVWDYSMSTDVLGRIVEVASGMPFDRFIEERITRPLGMTDTAFQVSKANAARIAEPQGNKAGFITAETLTTAPKWFSGGGGLVSTAGDYGRFCRMLLNGGELDGVRLLSPRTVALMTSDSLPPGIPRAPRVSSMLRELAPTPEMGQGFGLGFAVRTDSGRNPLPGSIGDYSWVGVYGTYFWVDPKEKLFTVLMIQVPFAQAGHYFSLTRELVYQALIR